MLYATRINKEYVNEDELAKSRVREFYRKQNEAMYGEEKETKADTGALTSQLKYGIDSLFENFRNAVEQVLSADYNGDLTQQKSYEVIKKYNQLSSYLKNVINIKALTKEDQDKIEKEFEDMRDKLLLLKKIATDNNFIDKDDISDMVDTILKIKVTKELEKVSSQSVGMVENIKSKNESLQLIQDSVNNLITIENDLKNPIIQTSTKLQDMADEYKILYDFFDDKDLNPLEFALIKTNADAVTTLRDDIKTDIQWFDNILKKLQNDGNYIQDTINKGFASLTDGAIRNKVDVQIISLKNQILESEKIQVDKLDPTDPNYATDLKNINDTWKKALDKIDKQYVDLLKKSEITERDTEFKKYLPAIATDYKQTYTYANGNDQLNENELLDEEKEINRIVSGLNKLEENVIKLLDGQTEAFIKKVIRNPTIAKSSTVQKKTSKTQVTTKKVAKVQLPPTYTTYESFKKKFEDTVADYLLKPTNYTNFNEKSKQHMRIKARWKAYEKMSDADKLAFFT